MDSLERVRMDFHMEVVSANEETGEICFVLRPDPERYEWRTVDGEKALYDKFDDWLMPLHVLVEGMQLGLGTPIYYQPPEIKNAEIYIDSRSESIGQMLDGESPPASFEDKSEEFLESLAVDELGFVIMSLDMVGSTQLASQMDGASYARVVQTLLYELSEIVPKFHGHVLKYTGDGLIAYFPEPSFITKNDLALDCALTLRALVYLVLNRLLAERALPEITIRIGMESGEARLVTMGSPATKQHKDIIGEVISLAAKIEKRASSGEVLLGGTMERNLHTRWRTMCEPADLGPDWKYLDAEGNPYQIHRFRGPGT